MVNHGAGKAPAGVAKAPGGLRRRRSAGLDRIHEDEELPEDSLLKAFLQRDAPTVYGVLFFLAMLFILLVVGVLYAYNARREVIFARWEKFGLGNFLGAMLLKQLEKSGSLRPPCAWAISVDPLDFTPVMLDVNSRYHVLALPKDRLPPMVRQPQTFRIRSYFQQVHYFSYQSYDIAGEPIDSLIDYQLSPATGKNPFSDVSASQAEGLGTYEIYLTESGKEGHPNEMRLFPQGDEASGMSLQSGVSMFMLRLYGKDPRAVPLDDSSTESWGSVPPPTVEKLERRLDGSQEWLEVPLCSATLRSDIAARLKKLSDKVLERQPTQAAKEAVCHAWHEGLRSNGQDGDWHARPHFMPFQGDAILTAMQKIPYSNKDSNYVFWCAKTDRSRGPSFVLKIRGTLPTLPSGLWESPRIAAVEATDMRYVSFNTVDMFQPKPTYQSLAGYDMEVFYKDKWQSSRGANRSFSIVFADTKADAERCKLYDPEEDMILTYENPDVRPPHVPTVIYRQLISRAQVLGGQDKSIHSYIERCKDEPNGHCIRNGHEDPELNARQRRLSKEIQQDYHIEGEVFICPEEGGKAVPLHGLQ